ncbi:MAG: hypothetical protein O3A46_15150 [Candidatus Poribacteria bacterium]|nr:hypothetical protein [Candidatus Poribacteria bacterium]
MTLKRITSKDYKDKNVTVTPSFRLDDGTVGEMIFDGDKSGYAVYAGGAWKMLDRMRLPSGETLLPYSPKNNLIRNRIVLLPTESTEYDSEAALLEEIQTFLHRYVDVTPTFERLCAYYVLLTWIYDDFNELPYLRVLGDAGSGKTRFLLTVGSLCYKPIFASGASTVSPLFRILDIFKGTLLIDEGDFRQSDEKAEIVKIFNNGNAKGFPVLRSETTNGKEYNPRAYHVYGPKIIGTRSLFSDRALESRCLTEEMGQRRLRDDVPINLPDRFWEEATAIRNRLLTFRFRHVGKHHASPDLVDRSIEPRMNQVFVPLLSIIDDEETLSDLKETMREYHRQYVSDKGMDIEGHLLEVIAELREREEVVSVSEIAERFKEKHEDDYDKKINPKWIGSLLRRKLHLKTERRREGYVIPASESPKVERLMERFGLKEEPSSDAEPDPQPSIGEHVNVVNFPDDVKGASDSQPPAF